MTVEMNVGQQMAAAIAYFVTRSKVPLLGPANIGDRANAERSGERGALGVPTLLDLEALLLGRNLGYVDIQGLRARADEHRLPFDSGAVERFFTAYAEVASQCDFRDFEPIDLPLRKGGRRDLFSQSKRRQYFYGQVRRIAARKRHLNALSLVIDRWCDSLDPARPSIILRSSEEVESAVAWMADIGFRLKDISLSAYAPIAADLDRVRALGIRTKIVGATHYRYRRIGSPAEYAIVIDGVGQATLPTERDFQRAVFAVICWIRAGIDEAHA